MTIWTIGHSIRPIEEFINALTVHGIKVLADVRRFPASRRYPHFNQQQLAASLAAAGIEYLSFPELGGRRPPRPDSPNIAWRNKSFRGYADYMETDSFRAGVERLLQAAKAQPVAIMCAEAVWWRCHRALIADYFKATGFEVIHIMDANKSSPHPYTSAARIIEGKLSYAGLV